MEKRIELEKRRRSADQLYELILDNCRSTSIEGLTEEFINLRFLSLIGVGLTNLKGFPKLAKLRKLELSDNRIAGGLHILKDTVPSLMILNLSNNKIKDLETLEPLKDLQYLKILDLYRNDITQSDDYREKIFALLPGLSFIDSMDREGKDAEESDLDDEEIKEMNGKREEEEESILKTVGADGDEEGEEEEDDDDEDDESDEDKDDSESESSVVESEDDLAESVEGDDFGHANFDDGVNLKAIFSDQLNDDSTELTAADPYDRSSDDTNAHFRRFEHHDDELDGDNLGTLIGPPDELKRGKKRKHEDEFVDSD